MMTAAFACFVALSPQTANVDVEPLLAEALAVAGLSPRSARFDEGLLRLFRRGEFTSPMYSAASENPWRLTFLMDAKRRELGSAAGKPSDTLNALGAWTGWGTRRALIGNPNAADEEAVKGTSPLAETLTMLKARGVVESVPSVASVPEPVQRAAALILRVAARAQQAREVAFAEAGGAERLFAQFERPESDAVAEAAARVAAIRKVGLAQLGGAAHDLTLAVQRAQEMLKEAPDARYEFRASTKWGAIRLTGGSDTVHPDEPTLLCIDTGGLDVYPTGASTASAANGVSVLLDARGNDRYGPDKPIATDPRRGPANRRPGVAGALAGIAVLYDGGGDDQYRSNRPGLGSGRLGFGVLFDGGGNDVYDAYADGQGFGAYGAGILEDVAGDDRYDGFSQVQGVGLTLGAGALIDRFGNDVYTANDAVIDFGSPQDAKHNVSMSQGAGNGRRADYLDGQSLAGGIGILYDLKGDDKYACGVFGQGVGYWMGVGALWDDAGNDDYRGVWYVQGASAHFAIGYLEDQAGFDSYLATTNMAQGAGHDFGVGALLDREGNDRYQAPNLSLGAGNANAIGWFVDLKGEDHYTARGLTLGKGAEAAAGSLRARGLTLGIFVDAQGVDVYPAEATWARDSVRTVNWTTRQTLPEDSQLGVFLDR